MTEPRWSVRQRERILRAGFPPPGSAVGGMGLVAIGFAALASWSYADPSLSWAWFADAAATAVLLGIGASQLVATVFEPLVARLAMERDQVRSDRAGDPLIGILTRGERRRIASAHLDPAQGRFLAGLYLLGGIGFFALWLQQTRPSRADATLLGLFPILLMIFGYAMTEFFRWQTLVASLRNELGDERALELMAPSNGASPFEGGGMSSAQWTAIRSAARGARTLRLITALGALVCGIEILLGWLAWRSHAGPGLLALASCGIAVAGCLTGYAAASARWRPLVAGLRDELGSVVDRVQASGSGPERGGRSGDAGEGHN